MLFAALVVPYFVDWNAFRSTFEREAEKILGQPVHVAGSADASLLPMPSLVFTDVRVGGTDDKPMMTIDRFALRVELMPLISGTIKVVEMAIERPHMRIVVDERGMPDWLRRSEASKALNPDAVTLEKVEVSDGSIDYQDQRSGRRIAFDNLNAAVDARSLLGPWKVEGGVDVAGVPTTFRAATGRRGDDGAIRVKIDANPASLPLTVTADGPISIGEKGLVYSGTFGLARVSDEGGSPQGGAKRPAGPPPAWHADGTYELTPDRLKLPSVTVTQGPADRPYTVSGAATFELGATPRFDAVVKARQLDLDRSIGKGPAAPADVSAAMDQLVGALRGLPVPPIPGRIGFDIPGIVVGGSVVQNLRFDAMPAQNGWAVEDFGAELPGRTRLSASGLVRTGEDIGFVGDVRLSSEQPGTFAAWWRGSGKGARIALAPFDASGHLELEPDHVALGDIAARLDEAVVRGRVGWSREEGGHRAFSVDLKANRLDVDQLSSLGELFTGQSLTVPGGVADSYAVKIATGALTAGSATLSQVSVDAGYADGAVVVNRLSIGDLAGAAITGSGRVADLAGAPNGRMTFNVEASDLTGSAAVLRRLLPGWGAAEWLASAAPDLAPAKLSVAVDAKAAAGTTNANLILEGSAGDTALDIALGFVGTPAAWRDAAIKLSAAASGPDSGRILGQLGYSRFGLSSGGPAKLTIEANGTPSKSVETQFGGLFGGLSFKAAGEASIDANQRPAFEGAVDLATDDLDPLLALLGRQLPGLGEAIPLKTAADVSLKDGAATIRFADATIGERRVSATLAAARPMGRWKVSGDVTTDAADLGFVARLGLGLPETAIDGLGDDGAWSQTTFGTPVFGDVDIALDVKAGRLDVLDGVSLTNAAFAATLAGARTDVTVKSGDLAGGKASGSLSISGADGQSTISGQLSVEDAMLADLVWQKDGRSVGEGRARLSAEFEGTGRSLAGVVSTLSGGGALRVTDGVARFVNPAAFSSVMRASEAGREISEDELRKLFTGYLDAGTLTFSSAEAAFSITAGTIRAQNIQVASEGATTSGGATVDLNRQTLNSQWTLTVDPGADRVSGATPQVGLSFAGPFDAPERRIDVAPLAGFLSVRAFEREVERIEKLQAEILEKERLDRLARFYREAGERRAEAERKAAAEAERQAEELRIRQEAEAKAKAETELRAQREAADKARRDAAEKAKRDAAEKAKREAEARARKAAEDAQAQQDFERQVEGAIENAIRPPPPQPRPTPPALDALPPTGALDAPMDLRPPMDIPN